MRRAKGRAAHPAPDIVRRVSEANGPPYRALYRSVYAQLYCISETDR